jgi:hypothetical protein
MPARGVVHRDPKGIRVDPEELSCSADWTGEESTPDSMPGTKKWLDSSLYAEF